MLDCFSQRFLMSSSSRVALIILDGWGLTSDTKKSAPAHAHTPFLDSLAQTVPSSHLYASEEAVGLPQWQVWNSEVGHSTLWSGRVQYQNLVRISKAISERSFFNTPILIDAIQSAIARGKQIHLMGLLSDGGVHSHIDHLFALIELLGQTPFFVHAFTDGRDTDPRAGIGYVERLLKKLDWTNWKLASIVWRYYAMDRDTRRERVKVAYDLLVQGRGTFTTDPVHTIQELYTTDQTDEFLQPLRMCTDMTWTIQPWDLVIFWNFRSDRARELTSVLTQQAYPEYETTPISDLKFLCMTEYDASFHDVQVIFPSIDLENTLGEVLSRAGKTQLRIAETEKYPHVTFFFNGGLEEPLMGEQRILIPSPKVATYDLDPAMSAQQITDACIEYIQKNTPDFICLNYANPDMVGHTGVFDAVVHACETVDHCLSQLIPVLDAQGYMTIILADHGNADMMLNDDDTPNTAHSLALVPCYLLHWPENTWLHDGSLADIAPTILDLLDLSQPPEMTGRSLLREERK